MKYIIILIIILLIIIKNRNYEILQNIKEINYNNILKEINKINNEKDIEYKIINIIIIYNKMINKDIYEIIYDINKKRKETWIEKVENSINIFGGEFVKNNKNICKMIIDDKEYEIKEKFNIKNYNKKILKIKLKGFDNITNMSFIFYNCSSLSSLPDITKWNTKKVAIRSYMFYTCRSLPSLPDISKWNINKVTDISYMLYICSSLSSLPDISKWNTNNATDMT